MILSISVYDTPPEVLAFLTKECGVTSEKIIMLEFFDKVHDLCVDMAYAWLREELAKDKVDIPGGLTVGELVTFRNDFFMVKKLRKLLCEVAGIDTTGWTAEDVKEKACIIMRVFNREDLPNRCHILPHPIPLDADFSKKKMVQVEIHAKHPLSGKFPSMLGLPPEVVREAYFRYNKGILSHPPTTPLPACVMDAITKAAHNFDPETENHIQTLATVMELQQDDVYRTFLNHYHCYRKELSSPLAVSRFLSLSLEEWRLSNKECIKEKYHTKVESVCYEDMGRLFMDCLELPCDFPRKGTVLEQRAYLAERKKLQSIIKKEGQGELNKGDSNKDMIATLCRIRGVKEIPRQALELQGELTEIPRFDMD